MYYFCNIISVLKNLSFSQFLERFPDDDSCLNVIFNLRYADLKNCPSCGNPTTFYKVKKRTSYACGTCGYHLYPLADTIMRGSTTKLTLWFYAIYLFSTSKNGVSAKELERSLGVTYKCAWRIGHKIREAMIDNSGYLMSGVIEVDEALIGGKEKGGKRGWGAGRKTCLVGIMERGGKVKVTPVSTRDRQSIFPLIDQNVEKGSIINTDEFRAYKTLPGEGYEHRRVIHSKYQWAVGDAHTNSIEGYWSNLKKSILGTHTYVSPKHLPKYLAEFDFRHNNRKDKVMFDEILKRII